MKIINESENWLQSNQGLLEYDWASSFCFALGFFFIFGTYWRTSKIFGWLVEVYKNCDSRNVKSLWVMVLVVYYMMVVVVHTAQ